MFQKAALLCVVMLLALLLGATPALAEEGESLVPSSAQLEFGAVDMHFGGGARQSVQFSDNSVLPLAVGSTAITGAGASSFQIVGDSCSGNLFELLQSCSVEVEFHPATGPQSASLELLGNETAVLVALSGSGITGTLSANPSSLGFSPIPYNQPLHEGEYQESEGLNIQNSLAGTQIQSATITGPGAASFSVAWGANCEHELLASGNSCGMGIRFAPTSPGPKSASLVIVSDSSASPLVVPLSGVALNGPALSLDSTQALLGDVLIGSSAQHTFTITNTGDYPLFIQQDFLISGTPLMFPVLSDTCGAQIVYPGDSCALTVAFEPSTSGEKGASIILITNTSPIHVIGIDGVGVRPIAVSTPTLTTPLTAPLADPPAAPAASPATAAASGEAVGAGSPAALVVGKAPHLHGSTARAALDTGLVAQCPPQLPACETVSFITASVRADATRTGGRGARTPMLLGSALTQLRGGQNGRVRVRLSPRALTLLRERGHLHARIETIMRAGGQVVAARTLSVALAPPRGSQSRAG